MSNPKGRRMVQMRIEAIKVVGRYRKDLGDIQALAKSIAAVGLMNPITVTSDCQLIAGQRRLEACRSLGLDLIDAMVADDLDAAVGRLTAERDENTERKSMTPEELVRLGLALEELERPKAQDRQRDHAGTAPGRKGNTSGDVTGSVEGRGDTRDVVGEALGWSGYTYHRARAVVKAADDHDAPEEERAVAREALAEMNETGIVQSAYKKVRKARDARTIQPQKTVIADIKKQRRALNGAVAGLSGITLGLTRVGDLHPDITNEEVAQWVGDLSKTRRVIEQLIKRLKERTNA